MILASSHQKNIFEALDDVTRTILASIFDNDDSDLVKKIHSIVMALREQRDELDAEFDEILKGFENRLSLNTSQMRWQQYNCTSKH